MIVVFFLSLLLELFLSYTMKIYIFDVLYYKLRNASHCKLPTKLHFAHIAQFINDNLLLAYKCIQNGIILFPFHLQTYPESKGHNDCRDAGTEENCREHKDSIEC